MNRLNSSVSVFAGLALAAVIDVPGVAADSVRVPIRSANARTRQFDPNANPTPAPLSPTPLPSAPLPDSPSASGSQLPPQPSPDLPANVPQSPTNRGGGTMYQGPLGGEFQAPPPKKKEFLGDSPGASPLPIVNGTAPQIGDQPTPGSAVTGVPFQGSDGYGIAPPPGTLGQTYKRRSRPIDDEKHPRVGMVDVHLSENYEVTAKGMKVKWTGKVWRLESDPLWPGRPHIIEVKSEWGPEGSKQNQVRSIRLIMGRIVDLEF